MMFLDNGNGVVWEYFGILENKSVSCRPWILKSPTELTATGSILIPAQGTYYNGASGSHEVAYHDFSRAHRILYTSLDPMLVVINHISSQSIANGMMAMPRQQEPGGEGGGTM
jgi:hypothetical protein